MAQTVESVPTRPVLQTQPDDSHRRHRYPSAGLRRLLPTPWPIVYRPEPMPATVPGTSFDSLPRDVLLD
jgi:hypothetical protein